MLRLRETVQLHEAAIQPDGSVVLELIRPCVGKGRGRHLYEADMLAANAGVFTGWKMYVDHLSDQARRALGGLPRSIRDLGGRVTESWWDPSVPADPARGFGQGAVMGRAKPVPYVRDLIESDPELVELSINGDATGVRPTTRDGQRVLLVEGIKPKGSVDFVTEAGAGGRVVALMEAHTHEDQEAVLFEQMTKEEFSEWLNENRPDLLEALSAEGNNGGKEGDDEVEITPDMLREVLASDEGKVALKEAVEEFAQNDEQIAALVEAAVAEERDAIRAEAEGHASRQIEVRDLRDKAHSMIESAKLPERLAAQSKAKFDLTESGPTEALDVLPELDDDGNVVKSAADVLTESVEAEIASQRDLAASFAPTRVRGQGPSVTEGKEGEEAAKPISSLPKTAALLQEAGFDDPDKVYAETA
jgi:hypothetical protein